MAAHRDPKQFRLTVRLIHRVMAILDATTHFSIAAAASGEAVREVLTVAREQAEAAASAPLHQDAEAVVLDLVYPAGTDRQLFGWSGQTRSNAGFTSIAGTPQDYSAEK